MSSPKSQPSKGTAWETHSVADESDDDFAYEEVSVKDEWNLPDEGEEDLEATMKAVHRRLQTVTVPGTSAVSGMEHLEALDDFIRNSLSRMEMLDTLDCFQTEWYDMVQRGLLDPEQVGVVPSVYTENQHLQNALKTMKLEREAYELEASRFSDVLLKVMRARDHYRLQHERVVQEKDKLMKDVKRLEARCRSYEPALERMNEKYETVMRHLTLLSFERDRAKHLNASQGDEGRGRDCVATSRRDKTRL